MFSQRGPRLAICTSDVSVQGGSFKTSSNCFFFNVATYSSIWTVDVSSHTSAVLFSECAEAEKDHCRFDPSDVDICDQDTLIFCTSS